MTECDAELAAYIVSTAVWIVEAAEAEVARQLMEQDGMAYMMCIDNMVRAIESLEDEDCSRKRVIATARKYKRRAEDILWMSPQERAACFDELMALKDAMLELRG